MIINGPFKNSPCRILAKSRGSCCLKFFCDAFQVSISFGRLKKSRASRKGFSLAKSINLQLKTPRT